MDQESDSGFWSFISKLFGRGDNHHLEELILEAKEDGEVKADEVTMLLNVLRLGRKLVQEIMIPRTDIVCSEISDKLPDIVKRIIESGHSRIPIYKGNKDNIIGILHAKDLLQVDTDAGGSASPRVSELMREPYFIPETKNVQELLRDFRSRKVHLAIALDEYGGTSGLVTFEDVLEEIVGEIEDEYDVPGPEDIQVLDNEDIMVSGRTPLSELAEYIDPELDSDQVETIGGYLSALAGRVPSVKDSFSLEGYRFTIKEADAKQVHWILIHPPESDK